MKVKTSYSSIKTVIDNNPSVLFFWNQENEYCSNDPNEPDINRYCIRIEIQSGVEQYAFLSIDGSAEQIDFDANYKTLARAIESI